VILLLAVACLVAFGYQIVALLASLRQQIRRDPVATRFPGISILKPVRGRDPEFYEAIRSHAVQEYPGEFEILFGIADPQDPALEDFERLRVEFPTLTIRLVHSTTTALNGKVGVLQDLARRAKHDILLVNDSDIRVPQGYLRQVIAPLEDPNVGMVTCLYRATAATFPGRFEALGIVTDFAPSTLVAPMVGINEFGLGSTLVFRRKDLEAVGGFAALADYIADDYQLAKRITGLGLRVHLSKTVVETRLGEETWSGIWHHQLRWHRTIRVSRGAYVGLPVTNASLWALIALGAGAWWLAAPLIAARISMAVVAGWRVLGSPLAIRMAPLVPFRDLWGFAVWAAGLTGSTVRWRGKLLRLLPDGRIARF
jgi:ceramide glucosyltransferase